MLGGYLSIPTKIPLKLPKLGGYLGESTKISCRNPSLGFATKVKGCKVAGQEGSPEVMLHALESARECEGIDPRTPKGTPTLGVGVPVDS